MNRRRTYRTVLLLAVLIAGAVASPAGAQGPRPAAAPKPAPAQQGPPNALQGFSQNRDQPVQIEATTLEVRDKDKTATFTGNVHVIQGDTDMRCRKLVVHYEDAAGAAAAVPVKAAQPGPGGSSRIRRLDADGDVVVTQKDQTATGDKGVFDVRANTVTLSGNVVVSQCQSVMRGERLIVDLTTGASRLEGGRVQGLFQRGGNQDACKDAVKTPGAR